MGESVPRIAACYTIARKLPSVLVAEKAMFLATDPVCVTFIRSSCIFWAVGAKLLQTYHQMPGEGKNVKTQAINTAKSRRSTGL